MNTLQPHFFDSKRGEGRLPCYYADSQNTDLVDFYTKNRDSVLKVLQIYGAVLFRDFDLVSLSQFNDLANTIFSRLLDYTYRSTPRTRLGGSIYTATEYPSDRWIQFHNECSYSLTWPEKLLLFCAIAPEEGGETAIADSRAVYKKIHPEVIEKFEELKVMYVRNYLRGVDLSWQEVFQTQNRQDVEKYCQENFIKYEWQTGNVELTTKQVCQATYFAPLTREKVWFNQAHLFHLSSLRPQDKEQLEMLIGKNNFTRNAFYGNGEEIEESYLTAIRNAYEDERIEFKWKKKDVLLIDNVLIAHSRNPFKGNRKIAVAMGN